jgi:O-antigen/teichoic acid export membrane protein
MSSPGVQKAATAGESTRAPETSRISVFTGIRWSSLQLAWSTCVRLGRGAIIPKLLLPAAYGLSNSALLPMNYVRYTDLGILDQLAKRLPLLLGEKGRRAFEEEAGRGGAWILLTSLLGAAVLVAASYLVHGPNAEFYRSGIRLVAAISVIFKFRFFLNVLLYAREEYRQYNLGPMCADGSNFLFAVGLVVWLGPIGVLWGLLCSEIVTTIYTWRRAHVPRLRFEPLKMFRMAREGIVLLIVALTEVTMMTLDQLVLVRFFPVTEFGIYTLGLFMTSALLMSASVFLLANARILRLSGAGFDSEAKRLLAGILSLHGLLVAIGIGLSVPLMSLVVCVYLPRYNAGISLYALLAGLAIVRGPMILLRPFYLSRNNEKQLITCQLAGLGLMVLLDAVVVLTHGSLVRVALASLCGYALSTTLLAVRFERSFTDSFAKRLNRYGLSLAAGMGCAGFYWLFATHPPVAPVVSARIALQGFAGFAAIVLLVIWVVRGDLKAALTLARESRDVDEIAPAQLVLSSSSASSDQDVTYITSR